MKKKDKPQPLKPVDNKLNPPTQTENEIIPPIDNRLQVNNQSPKWLVWLLMAFAFLLYANTLGHQYAFDDSIVITENSFTKKGVAGIPELISQDFFNGIYGSKGMELTGGRYRPVSLVMFAVEWQISPNNPFLSHFINVLFYALTIGLLFLWLQRLFKQPHFEHISAVSLAFIACLLFAAHPIHTEIVANIKSRDEIMGWFFTLLALLAVDKIAKKEATVGSYITAFGCFFLALLSKENAIVFALLIPLLFPIFYRKELSKMVLPALSIWAAAGLYLILRQALVGSVGEETNLDVMENPFVGQDFNHKFGTIGLILGKYLISAVFPLTMSSDYSFNQIPFTTLSDLGSWSAWLLYAVAGIYAVWALLKKQWQGWAILLYILPLGLVTNILFNVGAPMADRFLYLSTVGICMGLAGTVVFGLKITNWDDFLKHKLLLAVLFALLAFWSYKTFTRNKAWYNNETLFTADVKNSPNSAKMRYYYGNTNLKKYLDNPQAPDAKKYLDIAEAQMLKGFEINPKFPTNTYNVGLVYWNKENGVLAEKYLLELIKNNPTHITGNELLGKVYGRFIKNPQKAIYHLERVIYEFKSANPDNLRSLAIVYAEQNQLDKALSLMNEALKLAPEDPVTWHNLAAIYSAKGDNAQAQAAATKAQQFQQKK
jgi:protein O-mannosyl-transferase